MPSRPLTRRPLSISALVLLATGACATGAASTPANGNAGEPDIGPRLRANVWTVDDVELLRSFYDVARKEDCAFVVDGVANVGPGPTYWCLPRTSVTHDTTGALALYADNGCTVPLALSRPSGGVSYVVRRGANACVEPLRVFRAEPAQTVRPFFFDGRRCTRTTVEVPMHLLGEEVPLTEFVSASEVETPITGAIARLELVTDEGARQTIAGFDPTRDTVVSVTDPGGVGDPRWFPSRLAFEGAGAEIYSDETCRTMVPSKVGRDALCPLGASFTFEGECGDGQFYALGPLLTSQYVRSPLGACFPANDRGVIAHERGEAIPRASFVPAQTVDQGTGRVRLRGYGEGGELATITGFFDSQTAAPCVPVVAHDGQTRCLPSTQAPALLYADPTCVSPAFEEALTDCPPPPAPMWVRIGSEGAARAYRVTGPATTLFASSDGACRAHELTAPSRGFTLEEVDIATFAVVTEQTR